MRTTIRLSLVAVGLSALLGIPTIIEAQNVYGGFAGGIGRLERGYSSPVVFSGQASIGRRISRRFETRADVFVDWWDRGIVDILCLNNVPPQACHPPNSLVGLAGNGIVNLTAPQHGPRLYLIGGVEAHYFMFVGYGNSNEASLGVSGGVGYTVPAGRRSRVFLETRYHHVLDGRYWLPDIVPLTIGFQF